MISCRRANRKAKLAPNGRRPDEAERKAARELAKQSRRRAKARMR